MNPEQQDSADQSDRYDAASRASLAESNPGLDGDEDQPGRAVVARDADEPSATGTVGQSEYPRDTESG